LIALGAEFSADEAAAYGLVNHVLDDEAFDDEVDAFALQFLRVSRSGLALTKHLLYQTDAMSFEDALRFGVDTNVIARMTEECQKGIERFLKKLMSTGVRKNQANIQKFGVRLHHLIICVVNLSSSWTPVSARTSGSKKLYNHSALPDVRYDKSRELWKQFRQ